MKLATTFTKQNIRNGLILHSPPPSILAKRPQNPHIDAVVIFVLHLKILSKINPPGPSQSQIQKYIHLYTTLGFHTLTSPTPLATLTTPFTFQHHRDTLISQLAAFADQSPHSSINFHLLASGAAYTYAAIASRIHESDVGIDVARLRGVLGRARAKVIIECGPAPLVSELVARAVWGSGNRWGDVYTRKIIEMLFRFEILLFF
ncbi:hypothetical protein HK096_004812 [Nowakowskiella sp. JEL0078]|nr:hypothetical protein HK096_004812 [Nowakowskiella sp. JEL0078]